MRRMLPPRNWKEEGPDLTGKDLLSKTAEPSGMCRSCLVVVTELLSPDLGGDRER